MATNFTLLWQILAGLWPVWLLCGCWTAVCGLYGAKMHRERQRLAPAAPPKRKGVLEKHGLLATSKNTFWCETGQWLTLVLFLLAICEMVCMGYFALDTAGKIPYLFVLLGFVMPFAIPAAVCLIFSRLVPAFALGVRSALQQATYTYLPMYLLFALVAVVKHNGQ